MTLLLTCLLISLTLISGNIITDYRRIRDRQQRSVSSQDDNECQEGDPLGESYSGKVNVTASGRTCQVWAASQPHEHSYTHVGEHNYCRNPYGDPQGVYCYTTDPEKRWEYCSVPRCASQLKVFDFSADNDHAPDSNGEFTSATPVSYTHLTLPTKA